MIRLINTYDLHLVNMLQVWLPLNRVGEFVDNQGLFHGYSGIPYGATFTDGYATFDGSDDYIELQNINKFFVGGSTAFSVCFWLKHNATAKRGIVFGNHQLPNVSSTFNIEINTSNKLRVYWNANPDWTPVTVTSNVWEHFAIIYTGTQLKVYKNGSLSSTMNKVLATTSNTGYYRLGRDSRAASTTTPYQGCLSDFRIYDHALSNKEVYDISMGLCAHYRMDSTQRKDGTQSTMPGIDCSGYNNDLDFTSGSQFTNDTSSPIYNYSTKFNGSSRVTGEYLCRPIKAFSVWVYLPTSVTNQIVFTHIPSKLALGFYNGSVITTCGPNTANCISNAKFTLSGFKTNAWNHFAGIINSSGGCDCYMNGVLLTASGTDYWTASTGFYIGGRDSGTTSCLTSISDLRFYSKSLNEEDVKRLYSDRAGVDDLGNLFIYDLHEGNKELDGTTRTEHRLVNNGVFRVLAYEDGAEFKLSSAKVISNELIEI